MKTLTIRELADMLQGRLSGHFDKNASIVGTCPVDSYVNGKITFVKSEKYGQMLARLQGAVVLVPEEMASLCQDFPQNTYVIVKDVVQSMMKMQEFFYGDQDSVVTKDMRKTAHVHGSAKVGTGSYIADTVYIGEDVVIGDRVEIMHGSCILHSVVIGNDTHIYPGVCIYPRSRIGNGCVIHAGACIGSDGFRFEQDFDRKLVRKMYHAGQVIIGDRVEIGANCTIDRATFEGEATCLCDDVKLDNLVHIPHNARIGARTLIAAKSGMAGSVRIGEDVWIGIGVTISNGVTIGNRAKLLLNAVVAYDVPEGEIVSGFYAMPHRRWKEVWNRLKDET